MRTFIKDSRAPSRLQNVVHWCHGVQNFVTILSNSLDEVVIAILSEDRLRCESSETDLVPAFLILVR